VHTTLEVAWKRFQQRRAGEQPLTEEELLDQHKKAQEVYAEYTMQMQREQERIDQMNAEEYTAYAAEQRAAENERAARARAAPAAAPPVNFAAAHSQAPSISIDELQRAGLQPPSAPWIAQQAFITLYGWRTRIRPLHVPRRPAATDAASDSDASDSDSDD
jgi:hypothetical protein